MPCFSAIASGRPASSSAWVARSVAARYSQPVRYFCPTDLRKSSESNSARSIGLMSVPALVNSAASLAISSGRGVSVTKCRANAVAIVRAVAGWWAR